MDNWINLLPIEKLEFNKKVYYIENNEKNRFHLQAILKLNYLKPISNEEIKKLEYFIKDKGFDYNINDLYNIVNVYFGMFPVIIFEDEEFIYIKNNSEYEIINYYIQGLLYKLNHYLLSFTDDLFFIGNPYLIDGMMQFQRIYNCKISIEKYKTTYLSINKLHYQFLDNRTTQFPLIYKDGKLLKQINKESK